MDDSYENTLRENATEKVPLPLSGNYLYGGLYFEIDLDLTGQENGKEIYLNRVIVLNGGRVAGNFAGTLYVPEGVGERVDSADAPNLEVRERSFGHLAQLIWWQPTTG